MSEPRAQRTLVKSPPELWAEISDVSLLARHLGEFGDIRITRLEAETTVVWEGDRARGTVELEPSGWGTKVTITAEAIAVEEAPAVDDTPPAEAPATEVEAAETVEAEAEPEAVVEEETPVSVPPPTPEPPVSVGPPTPQAEAAAEAVPAPRKRGFFARLFARRNAPVAEAAPVEEETPPAVAEVEVEVEVAPEPEAAPAVAEVTPEPEAAPAAEIEVVPEPEIEVAPVPELEVVPEAEIDVEAVLVGVLDDLGSAHHRPFSRG